MAKKGLLFILLFGIFIFGCRSKKAMLANAPKSEGLRSYTFKPEVSEVRIPIDISISGMEHALNNQMKGLLFENNGLKATDNIMLDVKVWKDADVKLDVKGNEIFYKVPLKLWSKALFQASVLGMDVSEATESECSIELFMKSAISIDSLWNVQTKTTLVNYNWIKKPLIKIGPLELPVTLLADLVIKNQKDELPKKLDESLKSNLSLKPFVEKAWNELQEPIAISNDPPLWLVIKPLNPFMTPFVSKTGKFSSSVGISAYVESVVGTKPASPFTKLPNLKFISTGNDKFSISLTNDISYATATELAKKTLLNKEFEFSNGKHKITISDIEIYPSKDKLTVKASMIGSLNGTVYLKGRPKYDSTTKAIRLIDTEFDLDSKNKLLKTAGWLLHGALERKLEPYLSYPIGDKLKESEELIKKSLTNNRLDKNILMNGQLVKLAPQEIVIMEQGIKTIVKAEGKIEIKVEGF